MNNNEIFDFAVSITEQLHIKITDKKKLQQELSKSKGETIILRSKDFIVWIDKYYIAYSSMFEPYVYYAYLTKKQIKEEFKFITEQLKTVKNKYEIKTLLSIKNQFVAAQALMNDTGADYVKTNQLKYVWRKPKFVIPSDALVLSLCFSCVQNFRAMENRYVDRVDHKQTEKDNCAYCNCKSGYDYAIWNKR